MGRNSLQFAKPGGRTQLIEMMLKACGVEEAASPSAVLVLVSNELKAISWPYKAEVCWQLGLGLMRVEQLALKRHGIVGELP